MMGILQLISEFYPDPEMPSNLLNMKSTPSNAAFCKHGTTTCTVCLLDSDVFPALSTLFPIIIITVIIANTIIVIIVIIIMIIRGCLFLVGFS